VKRLRFGVLALLVLTTAIGSTFAVNAALAQDPSDIKKAVLPSGWLFTTGVKDGLFHGVSVIGDTRQDGSRNAFHHGDRIRYARSQGASINFEQDSFPLAHLDNLSEFIAKVPVGVPIEFTVERQNGWERNEQDEKVPKYIDVVIPVTPTKGRTDVYSARSKVNDGHMFPVLVSQDELKDVVLRDKTTIKARSLGTRVLGATSIFSFAGHLVWEAEKEDMRLHVERLNGWAYEVDSLSPLSAKLYRQTSQGGYILISSIENRKIAIYAIDQKPLPQYPDTEERELSEFVSATVLRFLRSESREYLPLYVIVPSEQGKAIREIRGHVDSASKTQILFLKRSDIVYFAKH
jgi:hypothetical protein